jgi:thiol-disulfide isomerase/thioredoxin
MITELDLNTPIPGSGFAPDENLNIVMFFGKTCGPCKASMPHYEEVAKFYVERSDRIKFYKFHVWETDEHRVHCEQTWGIQGVPNFRAFSRGDTISDLKGGGDFDFLHKFVHNSIDEIFKRFNDKV